MGGGFAAAAHSALFDAPIVLSSGDALPTATQQFLSAGDAKGSVPPLTCVTAATACEQARLALGLPPSATVTTDLPEGSFLEPGQHVAVTISGVPAGQATVSGDCTDGTSIVDYAPDSAFPVAVAAQPPTPCDLRLSLPLDDATDQTISLTYAVTPLVVAYAAPYGQLTIHSEGVSTPPPTSLSNQVLHAHSWSPDGTQLAVTTVDRNLAILNVYDGSVRVLTHDGENLDIGEEGRYYTGGVWSPVSNALVAEMCDSSYVEGYAQVTCNAVVYSSTGDFPPFITPGQGPASWSPNGSQFVIGATYEAGAGFYFVDVTTQAAPFIAVGGPAPQFPRWAPDGTVVCV